MNNSNAIEENIKKTNSLIVKISIPNLDKM